MRCMTMTRITALSEDSVPLTAAVRPNPDPGPGQVLIRVSVCGVCHTEIDEIEGRTPPPQLPVVPGHQVVGRVAALGKDTVGPALGDRVGVAWIGSACGGCAYCLGDSENLCEEFRATGRDLDGGYAELMVARAAFVHPIPHTLSDSEAAPLLCAGAVGYRALRLTQLSDGGRLGFSGFGASAHIVLQTARHLYPHSSFYVFARSRAARQLALDLGAEWAGDFSQRPPQALDAVIDTTPAWVPVLVALESLAPGGRLVINAIGKNDSIDKEALLQLDYASQLWQEKEIKSVANLTRRDVAEFLKVAAGIPIKPQVSTLPLENANEALARLNQGGGTGALVLAVS